MLLNNPSGIGTQPTTGLQGSGHIHRRALLSVPDVLASLLDGLEPLQGFEYVPLSSAKGRVLASPIFARTAHPLFDRSAVDGYGISRQDLERQAPYSLRQVGSLCAGDLSGMEISEGLTVRLATGAPVPSSVAAIVMEEHCREDDDLIGIFRDVEPSANIRRMGEDVPQGAFVLQRGVTLDVRHIALLSAIGHWRVPVQKKVKLSILSTGDELMDGCREIEPGKIFDTNKPMLTTLLSGPRVEVIDAGHGLDDAQELAKILSNEADRSHLIITSGAAAGSGTDYLEAAVRLTGGIVNDHRMALKPGKPLLAGSIGRAIYLGLPGNPVAALVTAILFCRPLIDRLSGLQVTPIEGELCLAGDRIPHRLGRRELAPARVIGRDQKGRKRIVKSGRGGSASLLPLATADGLIDLPASDGDAVEGSIVRFHPFETLL